MRTADRSARLIALLAAVLAAFLLGTPAFAQAVLQAGPPFGGHAAMYAPGPTIGSPAVLQDSGPAGSFNLGQGLSERLQVNRLPGTGPFGSHNCSYDQPSLTGPNGAHFLCLDANALGGGLLSYGAIGGATPLPFNCDINNVLTPCLGNGSLPIFDPRSYGAVCGGGDATVAIQAAINAATLGGGWVAIVCPLTIAGTVTIPNSIRLTGIGAVNYPGQQDIPSPSAYPTSGPALQCTNTTNPCIMVTGIGNEIDHINFWNPQPTPPSACPGSGPCNNWTPTVFPFVIATQVNSGWQGLNIHNVTCTSCSKFIDLEGTPDYHLYTGTQIILRDLWCNPCLNNGLTIHLIDNPIVVSHVEFTPQWNFNLAPAGYYLRQNLIGFNVQYAAAPLFDNIDFFTTKSAIQLQNGTVTNNFGAITFAASAMMMTNVQFNQVCQAMTQPAGNGTVSEVNISNAYVWGDQSGFGCSNGKAIFSIPSNDSRLTLDNLGVAFVDTLINAGCGAGCNPGGGAIVVLGINAVQAYSAFTAAQNFVNAPSGTNINFGTSNLSLIFPASGAGKLMGPGPDATQAFMQSIFVGGGTNPLEGAVALQGSGSTTGTGFVGFFATDHSQLGFVGGCTTGALAGCSFADATGNIYLKPNYTTSGTVPIAFGSAAGGISIINIGALPTACTGLTTGTLRSNAGVVTVCP